MTWLALALVLASAVAHASWNFLTKASTDKLVFSWCFATLASILYLPLAIGALVAAPLPPSGWALVAGTTCLHLCYFLLLNAAYMRGDLSLVYPIARGTGLALVPLAGVFLLGERISLPAILAIGTILLGLFTVYARTLRFNLRCGMAGLLSEPGARFAFATGLVIAAYSVWDKYAVAVVPPPVLNYFGFLGMAIGPAPWVWHRREALRHELTNNRRAIVAAAILSPLAYLLVLSALTFSRVSYVAPAREVGIVIGTALGSIVLREPFGRNRLLGAALITVGVIGLALAP